MKKMILAGIAAMGLTGPAMAADLGAVDEPIKLAINEWTGQHISTHVAGQMLEKAGYKVEYVTAGYMNMWQAMADGEVHGAMEVWTSNVSENYAKLEEEGKIVDLGGLGLDAKEGFAYPAHVAEICPGLPDWEALKDCAAQFATAETLPMGRLVDYPADWGTPGGDRVSGLELPFKPVPAGSEGALIAELRASTEKQSPLLIVFWQPHWAMSEYNVQFVDLPPGEAACYEDASWGTNPDSINDCDFIPTRVFKTAWAGMEEKWPAAHAILSNMSVDNAIQQPMMGEIDVDGKAVEDVVAAWMDANEAVWKPIVDAATN